MAQPCIGSLQANTYSTAPALTNSKLFTAKLLVAREEFVKMYAFTERVGADILAVRVEIGVQKWTRKGF